MSDESLIPEWAIARANQLVSDEVNFHWGKTGRAPFSLGHGAFARYIADHEPPPPDPLEEAFATAVGDGLAEHEGWGLAFKRFQTELSERGLRVVEIKSAAIPHLRPGARLWEPILDLATMPAVAKPPEGDPFAVRLNYRVRSPL